MDDERRSVSLCSGDEVVFENVWLHERSPHIYPKVGTHGIVLEILPDDSLYEAIIQWTKEVLRREIYGVLYAKTFQFTKRVV